MLLNISCLIKTKVGVSLSERFNLYVSLIQLEMEEKYELLHVLEFTRYFWTTVFILVVKFNVVTSVVILIMSPLYFCSLVLPRCLYLLKLHFELY